jgi:alpha-1,4-digalacturonate transport system permease protein
MAAEQAVATRSVAPGDESSAGESWRDLRPRVQVALYVTLVIVSILMFFPFVWMASTALRPQGYEADLSLIPQPYLAFENFERAWNFRGSFFFQWTVNSVIISVVSTVMAVFLNSLSGFAFAKYNFRGRDFLFFFVLATLMVPFQVTMVPVYVTLANLGLVNTHWGVILPSTASAFGIFLIRQFMQSIPDELLDAARIDGSSEVGIYARIIVPLSMPAMAVLAIFTFLGRWNDYLLPLLVMNRRQMYTLQIGIVNFMSEYRAEWNLLMAVSLLSIVPTVALFLFFQRYFVRGIAMTGMKG